MPMCYGLGGLISVPQGAVRGNGAPPASFRGELGQDYFDVSTSPPTGYIYNGVTWELGGNALATTTRAGIVEIDTLISGTETDATVPTSKATKDYVDAIVVAGAPVSTTTTAGIGELATDAEAVAGTASTGALALFVTPSNLAAVFAAAPAIGGTTPAAGTFTDLTADGTLDLDTTVAGHILVTGAADFSIGSTAGSINITAGESASDSVKIESTAGGIDILASGAAAGEDIDIIATGSSVNITSTESATDSIKLTSTAGGIQILASGAAAGEDIVLTATGSSVRLTSTESATDSINIESTLGGINILASGAAAGEDINLTATGSSINLTSTENAALSIYLHADGGTSETIRLRSDQGTGVDSIDILSDVGGLTLTSGLASADAINLAASAGGVDIDGALQVNIASSQNAVDAVRIIASAGGIDIDAVGAATEDINITNTGGSVVIVATESVADAIRMNASGAAGGFDIDAGTNGFIVDTTGAISLDAAAASNFTATGAFDVTVSSTAGSLNFSAGEAAADAVNVDSTGGFDLDAALQINIDSSQAAATAVRIVASNAGGGIDIDAGTTGIAIDSTGAFSIDGAAASNVTTTGAGIDLTLSSVLGSVLVESTEDAALAIRLHANGGTSETIQVHADQGTGVASVGLLSDVGGITLRATGLASADAINLEAAAGGIDMDSALQTNIASSQAAATAIQLTASDAAGGITATVGTGGFNVAGDFSLSNVATKISMNGGAATDFIGTSVLVLGTVTIANTNIAAGDRIFLSRLAANGSVTLGELTYSISAGASFTVTSLILGTPASTQTADVSSFAYVIFRQT